MLKYEVIPRPFERKYIVKCKISKVSEGSINVSLPAWIPGSYKIRDLSKNLLCIKACSSVANSEVILEQTNKNTWHISDIPFDGDLEIQYEIYAGEYSIRGVYLDTTRGFFDGACVFLKVHGYENHKSIVLMSYDEELTQSWNIATSMPIHEISSYEAQDYWELIDHPFMLNYNEKIKFKMDNIDYRIILQGSFELDSKLLFEDLSRAFRAIHEVFGGKVPFNSYTFFVLVESSGYGGLEHRNSSSLLISRDDLPSKYPILNRDRYVTILGLFTHEYIHSWIVKRLKPASFVNPKLDNEVYTRDLWIYEGITSYYDDLSLVRSGVVSAEEYLKFLSKSYSKYLNTPGRLVQTLSQASFEAWTKFYQPNENSINSSISYYSKGLFLAMLIDMNIIYQSDCKYSLDDVMRYMWNKYYLEDKSVPELSFHKIVKNAVGINLHKLIDTALNTPEELPFKDIFKKFNINDITTSTNDDNNFYPTIGIRMNDKNDVTAVISHSPAEKAGICPGDQIVAVNGLKVTSSNLANWITRQRKHQVLNFHVFRHDVLSNFSVIADHDVMISHSLSFTTDKDEANSKYADYWLKRIINA